MGHLKERILFSNKVLIPYRLSFLVIMSPRVGLIEQWKQQKNVMLSLCLAHRWWPCLLSDSSGKIDCALVSIFVLSPFSSMNSLNPEMKCISRWLKDEDWLKVDHIAHLRLTKNKQIKDVFEQNPFFNTFANCLKSTRSFASLSFDFWHNSYCFQNSFFNINLITFYYV